MNEKKLIPVTDAPYVEFDISSLEGTLEDASAYILSIRNQLKHAYDIQQRALSVIPKNINKSKHTPFEQYEVIKLSVDQGYDYFDIGINVYRYQTDEELKIEAERKQKEAEQRKIAKEKKLKRKEAYELKLLAELKAKYETTNN
jgi:hypothetical protein